MTLRQALTWRQCRPEGGDAAARAGSDADDAAAEGEVAEGSSDGGGSAEGLGAAASVCVDVTATHPLAGTIFFDQFKDTGATPRHCGGAAALLLQAEVGPLL